MITNEMNKNDRLSQITTLLQQLTDSELNWLEQFLQNTAATEDDRKRKIQRITSVLPSYALSRIDWIVELIGRFNLLHTYKILNNSLINETVLESFGDALLMHHTLSKEALSKDRFEHILERSILLGGGQAKTAPRGNPGHDITINGEKVSLKTQADANIRESTIHISKFMELGHGEWSDKPEQLEGLLQQFLKHMQHYERIFVLRNLRKPPDPWFYELVEIPKSLLLEAKGGQLEMRQESKQNPKPGYCHVHDSNNNLKFELYFDGGGERKLQVKNIRKDLCFVHATWLIPSELDLL